MSISKIHPSRRSIASHKYDEEQDSLALNKRINLRINELRYFRNTVKGRYQSLPLLSPSCCRYSEAALQCINNLNLSRDSHVLSRPSTLRLVSDVLMRISNTRSAKLLRRLEKFNKKTDDGASLDTSSFGSSVSIPQDFNFARRKSDKIEAEIHSYSQDPNQIEFIKQIAVEMQNEVPLPVMCLVYKEVLPILNGIFQDYKKLLSPKPTEHFMTDDARKQSIEVAACIEGVTPS